MSPPGTPIARCVRCNTSFTEAEIAGYTACPRCGSKGVPMSPDQDVTIQVNIHELRILGIWSEHYAAKVDNDNLDNPGHESLKETVHAICARLEAQLAALGKHAPLTMSGELKQLREAFGEVTMYRNGVEETD